MNQWIRPFSGFGMLAVITMHLLTGGLAAAEEKEDAAGKKDPRQLRHVVMFKFKEGTSVKQIKAIEDGFRALPKKIDTIAGFEWGTDVSVENLADGFTHCFLVTFESQDGLKVYLPHEAHHGFVEMLQPHLDKVMVFDYWARK